MAGEIWKAYFAICTLITNAFLSNSGGFLIRHCFKMFCRNLDCCIIFALLDTFLLNGELEEYAMRGSVDGI